MSAAARKLLTLSDLARRTNISLATAQRYKKLYQDRIPSEGAGRGQRYPLAAVRVVNQLKKERAANRGAGRRTTTPKAAAAAGSLLTLTSIREQTGISYPTLQRYVRLFGDRLPHEGEGRKKRFYPEAVPVFRQLRAESRPGRPPAAGSAAQSGRKKTRGRKKKVRATAVAGAPKLLTLTAIGEQTGISNPTLQRYVRLFLDQIPHEGKGRKKRYHPEAVAVFRELRAQSRRGPRPKAAPAAGGRVAKKAARQAAPKRKAGRKAKAAASTSVEVRLAALESQVGRVLEILGQPITIRFGG